MARARPREWAVSPLEPTVVPPRPAPEAPEAGQETLLETAWRIVRRRKLLILQAIIVVGVAAYAYSSTREEQYTATASILFRSATDSVLGTTGTYVDPSREAATNEELLSLGVVADRTADALGGNVSAATVAEAVDVSSTPESDIMQVSATTTDPDLSARIANQYVNSFIAFRRQSAVDRLERATALAKEALSQLTPSQAEGDEGDTLRERISQLETAASLQTGDAEPVQRASAPTSPSAPQPVRNGILGAVLGLILGFSLAAIRERWNRSVYDLQELEQLYSAPVLARIPRTSRLKRGTSLLPRTAEAEAFRMLRAGLRYVSLEAALRSVLISSARPGEGKTTVATGLAETMAQMGDRVVLVEADMYRPRQASEDMMVEDRGLSDVLVGLADLADALEWVAVDAPNDEDRRFAVLRRGTLPLNPSELLESPRMGELMTDLEEQFDLVIVDTPPLAILSDALTLVGHVSGVIGVSALGESRRDAIGEFVRLVRMSGGALIGVVANFAPSNSGEAGHYYLDQ